MKGDPIVIFDGAVSETVTDYASADGMFEIGRSYRSLSWLKEATVNDQLRGSASGWRFDFEPELHFSGLDAAWVTLHLPSGVSYIFSRSGNAFAPATGSNPQSRYTLELIGTPPTDWAVWGRSSSQWRITDRKEKKIWTLQTFKNLYAYDPNDPTAPQWYLIARPVSVSQGGYVWSYTYGASDALQSITDSFGRTFSFTWNYSAYPVSAPTVNLNIPITIKEIGLPGGGKLSYAYDPPLDASGNAALQGNRLLGVSKYNASGTRIDYTTYQYENTNYARLLTGITDSRGVRAATFTYDTRGRALSSAQAGGQGQYTITYGAAAPTLPNQLARTVTNPLGKSGVYTWAHPANANQSTLTSIAGQASANCAAGLAGVTYDANGFVASETDEEGRVTAYVRDARNRPTSITRGSGTAQAVTTTLAWHQTFDVVTQKVEPGLTTNVTVDASGRVTQVQKVDTTTQSVPYSTNGQTRTWTYGYNSTGLLTSIDGPLSGTNDTVAYSYTPSGNLQTITDQMGHVTTVTAWNSRGQPTAVTDPNGVITTLAYEEAKGLLTQMVVDAAGTSPATTTIQYNAVGEVTKITQPNGAYENYVYDNAGRLTAVTNSAGETISYVRDAAGNATSLTIKRADATTAYSRTRAFDELGRLIQSVGAGPQTYRFGYDKADNLTSVTDPRSNIFSYGFDPLNRLISETDEENKTVTLTRDGTDAITTYTDARSLPTGYVRNGFDEVIQEVSSDRGTITYWRDARGLVTQRTDARGVSTYYTYDNAGRLTYKNYSGSTAWQSFNWDAFAADNQGVGRLVGIYSDAGLNWRVFDAKGRIWADWRTNNPAPAVVTQYRYDDAGNVSAMMYPSGRIVTYGRDVMGRISSVTTQQNSAAVSQTVVWNVAWNPYGPLASMSFGYGANATFTTDTDYRITRVQVGGSGNPGGTIDRSLSWMGDIVTSIVDNVNPGTTPWQYGSQSQSFGYTPTRRLSSASGYYGALSWTYDANGNRLTETANGAASTYAYPATSNRLSSVTPTGGTARSFTYDASGDMLTDTRTGALGMTFQYDGEGRLSQAYQTNAPSQVATYAYDAQDRLASRTVNGATTLYIHDINDHIIAETDTAGVTLREYIWLNDLPVAVINDVNTASPTLYYVHTDHLGRPARMVAQNWAWVWDVIYSPFGAVSAIWDSTTKIDIRFPGQWFQLESGLAYNWHRHYDATLGRYVQPDPIGYDGGRNLFGYVGQNPLSKIDTRGEYAISIPVLLPPIIGGLWYYTKNLIITVWEARSRGKTDPVQDIQPVNPGKDCNGKCNPCPPNVYWEADGDAHGSTGGSHHHGIEYNQDPTTCMCWPKRVSYGDEP